MNQQFVENLIALRNHYQSLQSKIESERLHAQNQLTHVNALLVDQLASDQRFFTSLIELRNEYQGIVTSGDRESAHIKEQLTHVHALLADQLVQQHSQLISIAAATVNETNSHSPISLANIDNGKSLNSANEIHPEAAEGAPFAKTQQKTSDGELPDGISSQMGTQNGNASQLEVEDDSSSPRDEEVDDTTQTPQSKSEPDALASSGVLTDELSSQDDPVPEVALVASEPELSEGATANGQVTKGKSTIKTPMLPQYQHLTKSQAIKSLLKENTGTILHIDYIIRLLHGELSEDTMRSEKLRMSKTLSEGFLNGLWAKVPGEAGCYTIDLKLVEQI